MSRTRLATGIALLGIFAFAFLGSRGLWEPDEGRYTAVALHMLRSGDWVFPAINDHRPHFTKPPLTYWAIASGVAALGANGWGARAWHGVAYVLTVLLVLRLGSALRLRPAWLPAVVFASFPMPYLAATIPNCDTLLALFETAAMTAFAAWWTGGPRPAARRAVVGMWIALALAFLTKGPPGLLPLAVAAAFLAVRGESKRLGALFPLAGLASFAVVGLGWYAVVVAARPELLGYFLRYELVDRIATAVHDRNAAWYGGIATYLPVLLAGTLPWPLVLLPRVAALRSTLRRSRWRAAARERPEAVLALLWVLVPLGVFLLARSRLPLYVLPLAAPLALLVAGAAGERGLSTRRGRGALAAWFVLLVALRAVAAAIPSERDSRPLARAIASLAGTARRVVFVQTRPRWGVALPLDAEVEAAAFDAGAGWADATVADEFGGDLGGVVYAVPATALRRFVAAARAAGRPPERLGQSDGLCLLRLGAAR